MPLSIAILLAGHPARKEIILKRTYEEALALAQSATGPLSAHIGAFVAWLIEQGYSTWCTHLEARRAALTVGLQTRGSLSLNSSTRTSRGITVIEAGPGARAE